MKKESEKNLSDIRFHRHHFVKTFYLIYYPDIFTIYEKVNGNMDLNALNWKKFVNSKELHDFIFKRVCMLSQYMIEAIAYGELAHNLGSEIHTEEGEIYIAVPMLIHHEVNLGNMNEGEKQWCTRVFTTMVCHMFFRDLYGYEKSFTILKEKDGWFILDFGYNYIKV